MNKKELDREITKDIVPTLFLAPFFDAWVLMLCLGGISHMNNLPSIAINYWTSLLIILISIALIPQNMRMSAYLKQLVYKNATNLIKENNDGYT
jgi:hypothetical protein